MEGLQRGPRRARRVAQNAATIRTPEVASTPPGPSSEADYQLNASQRLLRNYFAEHGTTPPQRIYDHLTPEGLRGSWQHPMFASGRGAEGAGTPEVRPSPTQQPQDEDEYTSPEDLEDDVNDPGDELIDDEDPDELDEEQQEGEMALPFDPSALGLKEISNLGKFTVSSHKPGSGVDELRNDDTELYWQSDGPQPHKLTVYFVKRVGIRDIRFYVDYQRDESYTPIKIIFKAGTSENNLIEFSDMELRTPTGWQQVSLTGVGGGPDGNTLACYVFQMQILENHQNGKDTHLRGIKIYAADTDARNADTGANPMADMVDLIDTSPERRGGPDEWGEEDSELKLNRLERRLRAQRLDSGEGGMAIPDFMKDPEIR